MTGREKLAAHVAQAITARLLMWAGVALALAWAVRYGLAGFIAGGLVALVFRAARPAPDPELDKLTGRKPD